MDLFLSVIPIIRDGPAAVILPFTLGKGHVKGTLSATTATVSIHWNGKAADRAGESENLPAGRHVLRGQEDMISCRIQDKDGTSWIDYSLIGPGFFVSGLEKAKRIKWEKHVLLSF